MPVNSEGPFGSDLFENSKIISTLSKKYFCNSGELIHFYLHAGLFKDESISLQLSEGDYSFTSSGTSGRPTKISFSRIEAIEQQRNLIGIMKKYVSNERSSAIICVNVNPHQPNARLAAARGFSLLAAKAFYEYGQPEDVYNQIIDCSSKFSHVILFSFTYDLFVLMSRLKELSLSLDLQSSLSIIHGGGWKKNQADSISPKELNKLINEVIPDCNIINYYGMIEQLGNVYPTCENGYHHTSDMNDIIIRDKYLRETPLGVEGIIQTIMYSSQLKSNFSILTEDIGKVVTYNCSCGRPGKAFLVQGRIKKTEVRGCSNAYF